MAQESIEEMGPVDYVVLEWPGSPRATSRR